MHNSIIHDIIIHNSIIHNSSCLIINLLRVFELEDFISCLCNMQTTIYTIVRVVQLFWIEPKSNAYVWNLETPEESAYAPNLIVSSRQFSLYNVLEASLDAALHKSTALMINLANYTAEVIDAIGEDKILRVLIGIVNLFSPHRFAGHSSLLAALTPIHASLLQFLRQYIDRYYGSSHASFINAANINEATRITITPDQKLIAFGRPLEAFSRLSADERNLLGSQISITPINERVDTRSLVARARADWLFAFCVEALNDVRVDEVSQNDYNMRLGVSEQYSPLIVELLAQFQEHYANSTSILEDESTHVSIVKLF